MNYRKTLCLRCREMVDTIDGVFKKAGFWCNDCIEEVQGNVRHQHVVLKVNGSEKAKAFFHWLLHKIDSDWPWETRMKAGSYEISNYRYLECDKCKGVEYRNPRFEPSEVKAFGKMCGLRKVKIKYWGKASKCTKEGTVLDYNNAEGWATGMN